MKVEAIDIDYGNRKVVGHDNLRSKDIPIIDDLDNWRAAYELTAAMEVGGGRLVGREKGGRGLRLRCWCVKLTC